MSMYIEPKSRAKPKLSPPPLSLKSSSSSHKSHSDEKFDLPKHFHVGKNSEYKFDTQDISNEKSLVTTITRRLESSRASSGYGQHRENEVFENRKRFPSAEPSSFFCGSPTFQRLRHHHQIKPPSYAHHHFNSYPNQSCNHYTPDYASESCHASYHSHSPARETLSCSTQSSPHSYSISSDFNHIDYKTEDSSKKRFSSYLKFHLGGGKEEAKRNNGLASFHRSSRQASPGPLPHLHCSQSSQSPEPPPRLNRIPSQNQETGSPLPFKRGFLDHSPIRRGLVEGSPALSRRYISPSPPQPPPRRLSECNSVPGSPQHSRVEHFRTRFHYTPEPQRRIFGPEL